MSHFCKIFNIGKEQLLVIQTKGPSSMPALQFVTEHQDIQLSSVEEFNSPYLSRQLERSWEDCLSRFKEIDVDEAKVIRHRIIQDFYKGAEESAAEETKVQ